MVLLRLACLFLCMVVCPSALAQSAEARAPHLTDRGRTLVSGIVGGGWSNDESFAYRSYYRWWLSVEPSVIYFVRDKFGLGGYAGGTMGRRQGQEEGSADVGVQALIELRIADRVSVYMMPSFGYLHARSKYVIGTTEGPQRVETRRGGLQLTGFVPLVYHPAPNVAIGFGPSFTYERFFQNDSDALFRQGGFVFPYSQVNRLRLSLGTFIGASF